MPASEPRGLGAWAWRVEASCCYQEGPSQLNTVCRKCRHSDSFCTRCLTSRGLGALRLVGLVAGRPRALLAAISPGGTRAASGRIALLAVISWVSRREVPARARGLTKFLSSEPHYSEKLLRGAPSACGRGDAASGPGTAHQFGRRGAGWPRLRRPGVRGLADAAGAPARARCGRGPGVHPRRGAPAGRRHHGPRGPVPGSAGAPGCRAAPVRRRGTGSRCGWPWWVRGSRFSWWRGISGCRRC